VMIRIKIIFTLILVSMIKAITYLALITFSIILNGNNSFAHTTQTNTDRYQCPMKCEGDKTYDKPGKCPVCGMALRKISEPEVYQCPMKCEGDKTYDKPGKCPVCGMALQKISAPELYRCPMKCEGEKTYDKPGKCPVCGMALRKISPPAISESAASKKNKVKIAGTMMKVMRQGDLAGTINLDTISNKEHLYGVGPVEYLKGELMIIDGRSYQSTVADGASIHVEETFKAKAPFFVYANIDNWKEILLPDSVCTIPQLESFLDQSTKNHSRPFAFRLTAKIEKGELHIVNLPAGTAVHSQEDAHQNQLVYKLKNQTADLVGFFSTTHQGIFTHHDSFVHIHLITTDRKKMGHLENMTIKKRTAKLYIPAE